MLSRPQTYTDGHRCDRVLRRRVKQLCVGLCFSAVCITVSTAAEVIDRILAVVNGSIITLSDVHAAARFGLVQAGDTRQTLDHLIERRLMLAEVERYGPPQPPADAVAAATAASRTRFASQETFDAALRETGMTTEDLQRHHRDTLRLEAYMQQRFGPSAPPESVREWVAGLRRRADISVLPLR